MIQATTAAVATSDLQLGGAFAFGYLIGWYVYYVNRYRTGDVQISDITTVLGVIGGGAVLALFDAKTDLFGAYGIGLATGFFSYFLVLIVLVGVSKNFDADWFLDGRRVRPLEPYYIPEGTRPTITPMSHGEDARGYGGTGGSHRGPGGGDDGGAGGGGRTPVRG